MHKKFTNTFFLLNQTTCRPNPLLISLSSSSSSSLPFSTKPMSNGNSISFLFQNFFQDWIARGQLILDELLSSRSNEVEHRSLITRILSHYHQYYQEKSKATHRDVFMMLSPPWFTTYERTFLWIAGLKPGILFRIVTRSVTNLSEEQVQRMNRLREETRTRERELSDELARIQEGVASSYLAEVAGGLLRRRVLEGGEEEETRRVEEAIGEMKEMMEALVQSADTLRMNIVREIVEILSPVQSVEFLAAATQLLLRVRMVGLEKDASRTNGTC